MLDLIHDKLKHRDTTFHKQDGPHFQKLANTTFGKTGRPRVAGSSDK